MFPLTIEIFECLHKQIDVFLHNYANVIWSLKGLEALPFLSWLLFFESNNFHYITKDASILHFQSDNGNRPSYFPTSTPLRHSPHRHD